MRSMTINRINVNASLKVDCPMATRAVSPSPRIKPPMTAPGMLPIPPNTAATKHFKPGRAPEKGNTVIRSVKYKMEPIPASRDPTAKVKVMVLLILMPIREAVS